jgi:hypothetical protein
MKVFVPALLSVSLHLFSQTSVAEQIPLFTAPHNFSLKEPINPPPPGGPLTYSTTGSLPSWYVVAWNIPSGKLPAFIAGKDGGDIVFRSRADEAAVEIIQMADGRTSYRLSQDGAALPCDDQGRPLEWDLFAGPNSADTKFPDAPGLILRSDTLPSILSLAHVVATATVQVHFGPARPRKGCAVSQAGALISVTLNNRTARQTLFYQTQLNIVCGPQPAARQQLCERQTNRLVASYYSRANPFGVADPLPLFGQKWLANNERRTISVDLLPHLLRLIETGPNDMDHDPAHWALEGYYNGQHIWGDVTMTSSWEDVSVVVTTR